MISCTNINLSFQDKEIFSDFNFCVEKGEHVCLRGQSGKGKTTLLKLLQGYMPPNSGLIHINGWECIPQNIKMIRDQIAWVPQNVNLLVNNGMELLKLMDVPQNKSSVEELLTKLGLGSEIIHKDFSKISVGQKQRVIIAICLSLNKKIILLDEPTAALDEESITLLINLIKGLKTKTIISASHNKSWLNNVDRVISL